MAYEDIAEGLKKKPSDDGAVPFKKRITFSSLTANPASSLSLTLSALLSTHLQFIPDC